MWQYIAQVFEEDELMTRSFEVAPAQIKVAASQAGGNSSFQAF